MTRTPLEDEIIKLSKQNEPPNQELFERTSTKLTRMKEFYREKSEIAPKPQNLLFRGFVRALGYSKTVLIKYNKLSHALRELAKDIDDETGADSES